MQLFVIITEQNNRLVQNWIFEWVIGVCFMAVTRRLSTSSIRYNQFVRYAKKCIKLLSYFNNRFDQDLSISLRVLSYQFESKHLSLHEAKDACFQIDRIQQHMLTFHA